MPRNLQEEGHGADSMSMNLTELEPVVREFVERLKQIKSEQELLKEDEKNLMEEFAGKLDMKTMKAAMRVVAVKEKVSKKHEFITLVDVLERIAGNQDE